MRKIAGLRHLPLFQRKLAERHLRVSMLVAQLRRRECLQRLPQGRLRGGEFTLRRQNLAEQQASAPGNRRGFNELAGGGKIALPQMRFAGQQLILLAPVPEFAAVLQLRGGLQQRERLARVAAAQRDFG